MKARTRYQKQVVKLAKDHHSRHASHGRTVVR